MLDIILKLHRCKNSVILKYTYTKEKLTDKIYNKHIVMFTTRVPYVMFHVSFWEEGKFTFRQFPIYLR